MLAGCCRRWQPSVLPPFPQAGFYTDAYDLFIISLVTPMLGVVYYPQDNGKLPRWVLSAGTGWCASCRLLRAHVPPIALCRCGQTIPPQLPHIAARHTAACTLHSPQSATPPAPCSAPLRSTSDLWLKGTALAGTLFGQLLFGILGKLPERGGQGGEGVQPANTQRRRAAATLRLRC